MRTKNQLGRQRFFAHLRLHGRKEVASRFAGVSRTTGGKWLRERPVRFVVQTEDGARLDPTGARREVAQAVSPELEDVERREHDGRPRLPGEGGGAA